MTKVAVYGSLLEGLHNHPVLGDSKLVGKTKVKLGPMYSMGGFPGIHGTGENETPVEVYEVNDTIMRNLDRLEGHPHFYFRTPIASDYGRVWVYLLPAGEQPTLPRVPNNDWRAYVEARRNAA